MLFEIDLSDIIFLASQLGHGAKRFDLQAAGLPKGLERIGLGFS